MRGSGSRGWTVSGYGGGEPPNSGQCAWWSYQSQSLLGLGRQSPVSVACVMASHSASSFRSTLRRSLSSGS